MYNINLLPPELQKEASIDMGKLKKMLLVMAVGLILFGGYGSFLLSMHFRNSELEEIESRIVVLEPKAAKIDEYIKLQKQNTARINDLERLLHRRMSFYQILRDINNNLPVDIYLTKLEADYLEKPAPGGFASARKPAVQEINKPGEQKTPAQASGTPGQNPQPSQENQGNNPPAGAPKSPPPQPDTAKPVPNRIMLEGLAQSSASVGVLVNNLTNMPYFRYIKLESVDEDSEYPQLHRFVVHAYMIGAEAGAAAIK